MGNLNAPTMAGLAYILSFIPTIGFFIPIVLFFVEKNRFAKFHAAQAAIINVGAALLFIVFGVLGGIFAGISAASNAANGPGLLFTLDFSCLFPLVGLAFLALLIWGAIVGFQGKYTKLPVVGNLAERFNGGPITPGMPNLP